MKKLLLTFAAALLVSFFASAQKKYSVYAVGFYNQENLFDTCHDEGKKDYDFLPNGSYHWDGLKYSHKLHNMARALADMGTDVLPNVGCAMIGLSEVENAKVLTDLVNQPALKARNMPFVHIEGHGRLADEPVTVIVCHWPSRFSGSFYRESAARQVKAIKDELLKKNPERKIFVMGDMNDDPVDKSMYQILGAKPEISKVKDGDMYNPWYNLLAKQGVGTLSYNGAWNLFDQIVMTPNLLDRAGKKDFSKLTFWKHAIQRMPYLFQTEGKYKGTPKRTTAGGVWLDGYSDHLPVCVYLVKEQK